MCLQMIFTISIYRIVRIVVTRAIKREKRLLILRDEFITFEGYKHRHNSHIYNNIIFLNVFIFFCILKFKSNCLPNRWSWIVYSSHCIFEIRSGLRKSHWAGEFIPNLRSLGPPTVSALLKFTRVRGDSRSYEVLGKNFDR